jgi:hypothetical protein
MPISADEKKQKDAARKHFAQAGESLAGHHLSLTEQGEKREREFRTKAIAEEKEGRNLELSADMAILGILRDMKSVGKSLTMESIKDDLRGFKEYLEADGSDTRATEFAGTLECELVPILGSLLLLGDIEQSRILLIDVPQDK